MDVITESGAKAILDKAIGYAKADQCVARLNGTHTGNVRYAANTVSTSGSVRDAELVVEVAFGKRVGTSTVNQFDDASLAAAVRRAEELARLAPENPEFVPAIDKQTYAPSKTLVARSAAVTPEDRSRVAADCIEHCRKQGLVAAGFFTDVHAFSAIANSKGNFGYQESSTIDFTCTVRTADGRGSGYAARNTADVSTFDAKEAVEIAARKAKASVGARALEPGKYTVILEPQALMPIMYFLMNGGFDAREADEGRSFLSKKGGGNRLGEKLFGERVTIHTDPWDAQAPVLPWDEEDAPRRRTSIVTGGRVDALRYSRHWAAAKGRAPSGGIGNVVMAGGDKSTDELVKSTKKGLLITRTHYVNMVDPQTMQLTGLTRDGTFYVENGEIKYPVKNFRFNESVVVALNNIEDLGRPERTVFFFDLAFPMLLPALKVRDFTFTSLSDAV
ncbi:TldD/PmbA family protein [Dokdonella sp.]|uniref:TldD/PmbA family protein n=1 Tax=Dokdonella sp. TaxID=2291710 RepID=UPI001B02DF4D|nr:TldD/PmbA family protein [Dokdonella sp.]MBO9662019.1 TldD/PmbA family protein [Dokdonella sp.]